MNRSTLSLASVLIVFALHVTATNVLAQPPAPVPQPQLPPPFPAQAIPWAQPVPAYGNHMAPGTSQPATPAPISREVIPGAMDVRFRDGSTLKVKLKDKQVEFETPYGRLRIPVDDIHKIDVGVRATAEERKRIDTALNDLGHADAKRQSAAEKELLALREKAYPALLLQTKSEDPGVAGRAAAVLEKPRAKVPAETLEASQFDVVHTTRSKISGRLKGESLRIGTLAFGDVDMKFADVRDMQSQYAEKSTVVEANRTAHVISKGDLDRLYFEYVRRLDPKGGGGVSLEPNKELTLVNFVYDPDRAHRHLEDLERDVKKIIRERGAKITSVDPAGPWEYLIRYEHKNVRGRAMIRFVPHHQNQNHWTMELKVDERPF